ncbi:MAG: hypothetical protein H7Y07_10320, partial [Pyrinomonadaceae bacterium]|nr:hypothetical protein [Sphingobacteriaceae bacterium]
MGSLIYTEFEKIEPLASTIGNLFESVCYSHIELYIKNETPVLDSDSKKQIGSLSEQAWDRYPIIKEVDLNIIEHSEEVCRKYLKYLRDELFWLISSTMERCDFDSWAKELNFTQGVLNGINIAPQGFSLSTILKENCTFRNFFSFVHGFINEANEVIEFLDQRLSSISDDIGNDWTNKFEPIRLTDICSNNEIPTIFYNLKMNG